MAQHPSQILSQQITVGTGSYLSLHLFQASPKGLLLTVRKKRRKKQDWPQSVPHQGLGLPHQGLQETV